MIRMRNGVSGVFVTLAIVLAATGCAGKETSTATAPSPRASHSAPQSGLLNGVADLKTYLEQVRPITSELATTVAALPDAVKGLSAKPDDSWTTSAAKLDDIAAQLDSEASSLAALTPPNGLQPVQGAAVTGIRGCALGRHEDRRRARQARRDIGDGTSHPPVGDRQAAGTAVGPEQDARRRH